MKKLTQKIKISNIVKVITFLIFFGAGTFIDKGQGLTLWSDLLYLLFNTHLVHDISHIIK